jgi:RNA polymerase sigma-70 factor (ECF subfamily)
MEHLENMTDEQLAMSYVEGNNRAFDILLSRNQSKLFFLYHVRSSRS